MKRHLILPATISAGLHVLLLGFKSSPTPSAPVPSAEPEEVIYYPAPEIEPPCLPEVFDLNEGEKPPPPEKAVVRLPEHYEVQSPNDGRQKLVIPPASPGLADGQTTVIPATWGESGGPRGEMIIDSKFLDRAPRALFRDAPHLPGDASDTDAVVTVMFVVGKDGRVLDAHVVDSASHRLDDECLRAVRRWRFEPGTRYAVPVAFRVQQTFVFDPTN